MIVVPSAPPALQPSCGNWVCAAQIASPKLQLPFFLNGNTSGSNVLTVIMVFGVGCGVGATRVGVGVAFGLVGVGLGVAVAGAAVLVAVAASVLLLTVVLLVLTVVVINWVFLRVN